VSLLGGGLLAALPLTAASARPAAAPAVPPVRFVDMTRAAGLNWADVSDRARIGGAPYGMGLTGRRLRQ
jgi:hypothetical protein